VFGSEDVGPDGRHDMSVARERTFMTLKAHRVQ